MFSVCAEAYCALRHFFIRRRPWAGLSIFFRIHIHLPSVNRRYFFTVILLSRHQGRGVCPVAFGVGFFYPPAGGRERKPGDMRDLENCHGTRERKRAQPNFQRKRPAPSVSVEPKRKRRARSLRRASTKTKLATSESRGRKAEARS